ncbi:MAG: MoxR-like ATPase [Candidatus Magnetoglobus multicellularis str. Araruama]|uniref:MoxR-like ATPase n=1 Tax=Candidatus Magnetoglobus multicellularis str. Araruama TaxID=890399 RepID=A0A1V1P6M4_9BACT|nr:MAG: MoxR-like ATPase [Candidatus Magnetoglobus multicellularis str. Araruama]
MNDIGDLDDVSNLLKSAFVARDEFIEMMIICAIAQEHLLIVGPPGTAKSEMVKKFALLCSPREAYEDDSKVPYFEYLLTRFTEPNEIFGPVDIKKFQDEKEHRRKTDGMLPKAEIAFLDEIFKSNSAILNALLTILNERVYYNAGKPEQVPLLCSIAATNEVPEDSSLAALYDRYLVRMWADNVEDSKFSQLYKKGWELEKQRIRAGYKAEQVNVTSIDKIRNIYLALDEVDISKISRNYHEAIRRIRAEGINVSDRRVIKLLKLIAASALRAKRMEANTGDFWILKHIWNVPEQIPYLQTIIEPYLEGFEQNMWSAERDLETINAEINTLESKQKLLKTDADYADFLKQAENIRKELIAHSSETEKQNIIDKLNNIIQLAMDMLEQHG